MGCRPVVALCRVGSDSDTIPPALAGALPGSPAAGPPMSDNRPHLAAVRRRKLLIIHIICSSSAPAPLLVSLWPSWAALGSALLLSCCWLCC